LNLAAARPLARRCRAWLAWAALLVAPTLCAQPVTPPPAPTATAEAAPPPRIGVATMQPGEVFFERFGHDAIVVVDPATGQATSYNFGFFDPSEPDFLGRFVKGEMMYYLVALPFEQDLASYRDSGRGVSIQWLDLRPEQARKLAAALAERAKPENARYHYDYFTANCATMVRDYVDLALDGDLQRQLAGRSRGNTFRSEAVRLASPAWWMWLGFDLGLGPFADKPLSRWQEAFVPMRLAESLGQVRNADGAPLVLATQPLLPQRVAPEPPERARHWWPWLLAGLVVAGLILAGHRRPRAVAAFAAPFWVLCVIAGGLLVFLWGFTTHVSAWGNRNLLLLNPLCLWLLASAWPLLRGRRPLPGFRWVAWAVVACGVLALVLDWLSFQSQFNLQWIVLLLPVHAALALVLGKQGLPAVRR
jgi:hypothetical protein